MQIFEESRGDIYCPYFISEQGLRFSCESCKIYFKDKQQRRDLVYEYCGHPQKYKECTIKQILDKYYERKYD